MVPTHIQKTFHQPLNAFYPLPATKTAFFARFGWGEDMKLMTGVAILFSFVFSVLLLRKNNKNIKMLYVHTYSYLCNTKNMIIFVHNALFHNSIIFSNDLNL